MIHLAKTKSLTALTQVKQLNFTRSRTTAGVTPQKECDAARINEVGVQMISENLRQYLFGAGKDRPKAELVEKSRKHLETFDLNKKKLDTLISDVDNFELPKLRGKSLEEHFKNIGNDQTMKYRKLISMFAANYKTLPEMPKEFCFKSGWTKYFTEAFFFKCSTSSDYKRLKNIGTFF